MEKLNKEQVKMVEDNLALVTFIAKKYFSRTDYTKNQDIIQEGVLAMVKAIPRFDSSKGAFSTFMYAHLDGHIKRFSRYQDRLIPLPHQKHLKKETMDKAEQARSVYSLDLEYKNSSNDEKFTLMSVIPDKETEQQDKKITDKIVLIEAIKSELNWKERLIIIYRFYFDLNQTKIGRLMGISQVHTHRTEKRALEKLKTYLIR